MWPLPCPIALALPVTRANQSKSISTVLAQASIYSARLEMTCFSGEKDSFSAAGKNCARIAGERLCEDARLRAFAAAGGLRPGTHAGYPWTNATARGPFTGLLAGAKHGARASRPPGPERGRLARNDKCGQDARAPKGVGLNAVRESGSAGVPPANHEGGEKPRERGLRFRDGSKARPGVKRRASRPPAAEKARQRAFGLADCLTRPRREGPWAGLREGIGPNTATARSPVDGPWAWAIP